MANNAGEQRGNGAISIIDEIEDAVNDTPFDVDVLEAHENTSRNTGNNNGKNNNNTNNNNNNGGTSQTQTRRQNRTPSAPATERTVIGATATIRGDIALEGDAQILGCVEGRLEVGGSLEVGPDAVIRAQILCGEMTVEGEVEGDVLAEGSVTLGSNATLNGDVFAEQLTVPAGATCKGMVSIGPAAAEEARPNFARKNSRSAAGVEFKDA